MNATFTHGRFLHMVHSLLVRPGTNDKAVDQVSLAYVRAQPG
jgi:hypothetical protein